MEYVSLFCPQCGVEHVSFAGLLARVDVRSNTELVAPFTCGNSHVFFVPLKDVVEALRLGREKTLPQIQRIGPVQTARTHQTGLTVAI